MINADLSLNTKIVFNSVGCLYLPVDDSETISNWYENLFNSAGTRTCGVIWETTKEKGLTCNFMTDEWVPGEPYEMFAVRFETDAIEELYARLTEAQVELEPMQRDESGASFIYRDPQRNKFQVWQRAGAETQPLRDGVPAFIGVAILFFPVTDPEVTRKWYVNLGVNINDSGQPVTGRGEEFHFLRSMEPGKTLNFYTGAGEIQHMAIAMIEINELEMTHGQLKAQGHKVQEHILDREGCGYQFQLYDPDGNKLDMWDLQTMVRRNLQNLNSPNWKDRYIFENCCFWVGIDDFFAMTLEHAPGTRHKRITVVNHAVIHETDPDGLLELVKAVEAFGAQYAEWAFEIVYKEGAGEYAHLA
ncbi:VOC family protein [Paenibacillus prosopidis]|uniref:VOC domain-containing protein n=1 Tax=Paenibacillus prosopidis TaxID=630520 RepID=A0A368W2X1_9BACL|nr:VOC family protein [Paenibacillus prosopidis]RCW46365.1 hypothetical protein DFP97_1097 [Paenibacillus prosopidis]